MEIHYVLIHEQQPEFNPAGPNTGHHVAEKKRRGLRRQLNTPLLLASIIAVAVLLVGGRYWHAQKKLQLADVFLERAAELEEKEDWSGAKAYLQRYLWINPDDLETRLHTIDVYEKGLRSLRDRRRLSSMLYEACGLAPERFNLRLRLAENLLILRDYSAAEKQARLVQKASDDEPTQAAKAKRVIALSLYPRAREFGGGYNSSASSNPSTGDQQSVEIGIGKTAKALADSIEDFPGDVQLASVTAEFYRRHQGTLSSGSRDAASYADSVIEQLLDEKPDDPDALISSYDYRKRYKLPDAQTHLAKALELAPDHHQALLLSAVEASTPANPAHQDLDAANDYLQRAIDTQPDDYRAYISLSRLEAQAGDSDKAIETLRAGQQRVGSSNFEIGGALTLQLIVAKRLPEAEEVLGQLEKTMQLKLPKLVSSNRREIENQLRILRGKLALASGDLRRAIVELKSVVAVTEQDGATTITASGIEARKWLAILMSQSNSWDQAATYWSSLAISAPNFGEAHRQAALAYMKLRQPARAIGHLERYLKPANPAAWTPDETSWLALLQAHLQQQLRRSSFSQNWSEFLKVLTEVKLRLPGRWESHFAEVDYLHALATPESLAKAYQLLQESEKQFANQAPFWRGMVFGYDKLDKPDDAQRALDKYCALETNQAKQIVLRATYLARNDQHGQAGQLLAELLPTLGKEEQRKLQLSRIRILLAAKQVDAAKELLTNLIASGLQDAQLLSVGIEAMLSSGDLATAEKWERQLQSLDLPDDFLWRYFRAKRLLSQFADLPKAKRIELGQLIASLRTSRPSWSAVMGLAALYAELNGDLREAIDYYELAMQLGDDSTAMLQRLVALLNAEGRYADADAYLSRLSTKQSGSIQVESLEISSAIRNNQVKEAVELARQAVDRHPEDPQRRIWLAGLLSLDKQSEAAEQSYRQALEKFPQDARIWGGLFNLLAKSQQTDKAAVALETLATQLQEEPAKRHFVLAQGYLQLGDQERAAQECQLALQTDASNVACRLFYAKLLLATDAQSAESQLQEILKLDADNGEAKRQLVSIWTASGRPQDADRAMELLDTIQTESVLESQVSNRLRAIILSRQGRSRKEREKNIVAARRIMEELLERSNTTSDVDRLLLAGIYEAEAMLRSDLSALQASREQLRFLINRPEPEARYLLQYVEFLFRQLSRPMEDSVRLAEWERLRSVFLADATARIDELEEMLRDQPLDSSTLQLISYRVLLKKIEGNLTAAAELLDTYVEQTLPEIESKLGKARSYLGIGNLYASIKQHQQAAQWYRKLMAIAPKTYLLLVRELAAEGRLDEAIDVCLSAQETVDDSTTNVAAILAQLMSTADKDPEAEQRVQPIIATALESHEDDVDLLLAVAVLNVTNGKNDEAIQHFRSVLKLEPNHPLALNNLATLLSERPNQLAEALSHIEKAIEISGRQSALLDTLGTIQLQIGDYLQAITTLEEAVATGTADARYYFHLAAAYQKAGQDEKSRDALQRARRRGLKKMILTQGDRKLLRELERHLDSNRS